MIYIAICNFQKGSNNMKTIGILGGLGPQATMDIERRIHKESQVHIPQHMNSGYPPLLVSYLREAPMKLDQHGNIPDVLEPNPALLADAAFLGQRADFLIIASNTPHFFIKEIEDSAGKPVLNMIDLVIEKVRSRKPKKTGVLAFGPTLKHRLYQNRLDELGIAWEVCSEELSLEIDQAIRSVMEGRKHLDPVRGAVINFCEFQHVDTVIFGCTELPFLYSGLLQFEHYIINPAALLAEAAVKWAMQE